MKQRLNNLDKQKTKINRDIGKRYNKIEDKRGRNK